MSLKTDRGLHVDAQMCHRLLSFLAQKKRLREVQVCSGYYSLQSIQGDRGPPGYSKATLWLSDLAIPGTGMHVGDKAWCAVVPLLSLTAIALATFGPNSSASSLGTCHPSCSLWVCGVGDSHQGRGVAALNLLSDLKDQCGWTVEQPKQRKDLPSTGPQVVSPTELST